MISFLVGCASSTKTYAPDGREAYSLDCSGTARNWACAMKKPEKSAPHVVMTLSFRVVSKAHQVAVTQTNNPQAFMQALYIFGQ